MGMQLSGRVRQLRHQSSDWRTLDTIVASRASLFVAAAELLRRQETEDVHAVRVPVRERYAAQVRSDNVRAPQRVVGQRRVGSHGRAHGEDTARIHAYKGAAVWGTRRRQRPRWRTLHHKGTNRMSGRTADQVLPGAAWVGESSADWSDGHGDMRFVAGRGEIEALWQPDGWRMSPRHEPVSR